MAPNRNDLMAELEASQRTVLRDIDFLRNDLDGTMQTVVVYEGGRKWWLGVGRAY